MPLTVNFTCISSGSVAIQVTKPTAMVAPAQVWLRAVNHANLAAFEESGSVYDGAHHEYYHEWTINGSPLSDWTKPENLPAAWNNPNKAYGREVAFLLPTAGSYVIDLVVTDRNGRQATASTSTLTVVTPESHFAEADRIYVDPDGLWAGVPAASRKVTTLQGVRDELASIGSGTAPWVLLRGGFSYSQNDITTPNKYFWQIESNRRFAMLSSYGGGRATITPSTGADSAGSALVTLNGTFTQDFLTITGIDVAGEYDAGKEHGVKAQLYNSQSAVLQGTIITINDVEVTGASIAINLDVSASGTHSESRMMVADCDITNWQNYAVFGCSNVTHSLAFVGGRFAQKADALHGGTSNLLNRHTPIRLQCSRMVYMSGMDLFSRTGWSPATVGNADQPCLRLFTRGQQGGVSATIERVVGEGGYDVFAVMQSEASGSVQPVNVVFENILAVSTAKTWGTALEIMRSGVTARNVLAITPDVPNASNKGYGVFRLYTEGTQDATNASNPIVIYNCTSLNLKDATNDDGVAWPFLQDAASGFYTNVTEGNNIQHNPNMTTAVTTYAPINVATALSGFVPRFSGVRYGYDTISNYSIGTTANGASFTIPYSSLTKTLSGRQTVDGGGATNQAYWTAIEGTDTLHELLFLSSNWKMHANKGHFTVTFGASEVTITNTSGFSWPAQLLDISLDRTSLVPAMDTSYASPATIPLPRPLAGSAAIDAASSGRVTPNDALGTARGATPSRGALEPA